MNQIDESNKSENPQKDIQDKSPGKFPKKIVIFGVLLVMLIAAAVFVANRKSDIQLFYAKILLAYAEKWPIAFSDAFDTESLPSWKPSDGSIDEGIKKMLTSGGRFEITVAPTLKSIMRDGFYNERAYASGNFMLQMKTNLPLSCDAGLIFRGNEQGEYYLFLIGNNSYTVEILRRNKDGDLPREAIILNTPFPQGIGEPDTLSVVAQNDSYYFYVNHVFVDKMSDDRLHGDQTGIELMVCQGMASESVFKIDDFTLRRP